jgi:3-hydroxymyristoyl/3-hydroxydecanoyl-(acyl carrier protein) dehydratase
LYGKGYLYASRPVNPADWFYPFHFFQDPVMPGSLGVEAVLETMQAAALEWGLGAGMRSPRFAAMEGSLTWRYRGQIVQQHKLVELEVHISEVARGAQGAWLKGDASLWVDGLRIYEFKDAAVALVESEK